MVPLSNLERESGEEEQRIWDRPTLWIMLKYSVASPADLPFGSWYQVAQTWIISVFPFWSGGNERLNHDEKQITNRMLQAGDTDFQGLILIFFNGLWEFHTQPSDWQLSLLQPIYKGHNKDKTDPASYRGIYLNDTLAKLFEDLLISRLTTHTELLNTVTYNQLGTNPDTQTHDAIYSLFAIIQHNKYTLVIDYSTAYPSVHRYVLSSTLLKNDIRGSMWHHLRARFDEIKLQVLHPGISARHTVDILKRLPEGSRLSPTLFGIFVAELVHELRAKFLQRLFTLDTNRQTHTPFDPHLQRTSGLEVYFMLMT